MSRTMTFVTLSAVTRLSNIGNWVGVSSGGSAGNQVSKNLATMSGKRERIAALGSGKYL